MTVERLRTATRLFPFSARANATVPTSEGIERPVSQGRRTRKLIAGTSLTFLLAVGAVGAAAAANPPWVHIDAAKKQVTFDIKEGTNGQAGQYNFDGYARGHMTITVPTGWHVTMKVTNDGSTGHSLEIIKAPKAPPVEKVKPAFKHADTKDLTSGMSPGSASTFSFTANKPGQYWMMCAVPGHALLGMWDHFVVSSTAKRPSVTEHS
ncbi:MAG: sulfocyanin-like copper-binding protein [Gammaproteobacteria bacterium]